VYRIPEAFTKLLSALTQLTTYFIEAVLVLGFFLKLFGANPTAQFVRWAYRSLDRLMAPFDGVFGTVDIGRTNAQVPAIFDPSILLAMVIYGIVLVAIHAVLEWIVDRVDRAEAQHQQIQRQQQFDEIAGSYSARPDVMGAAASTAPAATQRVAP
jgi:hypothetical protein